MGYYNGTDAAENVRGSYEDDTVYGNGGNDTITGSFASDWLYGGSGNDLISGGYQDDWLYGDEGNDRLFGGSGDDDFFGGAGADHMDGGTGDDRFVQDSLPEAVGDRIIGGGGLDLLELSLFGARAGVSFIVRDPLLTSRIAGFTYTGIERFSVEGSGFADTLTGWIYDDTLEGDSGNDRLFGGLGRDYLSGDDGNDLAAGGGDDDIVYGGAGADTLTGDSGDDNLYGGSDNDVLDGGAGNDNLEGNSGADRLTGGAGNDTIESDTYFDDDDRVRDILSGGDGQDLLTFGQNDVVNAGTGFDRVVADFSESTFNERWVFSAAAKTFNNGAYLVNAEQLTYHGGNGVDQITGGVQADTLYGGGSADTLNGGAGDDFLDGEAGNDVLLGGAGNDRLTTSSGHDRLFGNAGDDSFTIGFDENVLMPYNVIVDGGAGRDTVAVLESSCSARSSISSTSRTTTGSPTRSAFLNVEVLDGTSLDDSFAGTQAGRRTAGRRRRRRALRPRRQRPAGRQRRLGHPERRRGRRRLRLLGLRFGMDGRHDRRLHPRPGQASLRPQRLRGGRLADRELDQPAGDDGGGNPDVRDRHAPAVVRCRRRRAERKPRSADDPERRQRARGFRFPLRLRQNPWAAEGWNCTTLPLPAYPGTPERCTAACRNRRIPLTSLRWAHGWYAVCCIATKASAPHSPGQTPPSEPTPRPSAHQEDSMFKSLAVAAATLVALPAAADELRMSRPIEAASLNTDSLALVAYFVPLADDAYEVTATWLGDEDAEARRLVMRIEDGEKVAFSLPGHLDTLLTFSREFDAVTLSTRPVVAAFRNASL